MAAAVVTFALLSSGPGAWAQEAGDPHAADEYAESHYQIAVRFFSEGRYREALEEFDRAIALSPEPIFYCNRAVVQLTLREIDDALGSLRTCRDTFAGEADELHQIDAQVRGLEVYTEHLRPGAVHVARSVEAGARTPALAAAVAVAPPPAASGWSAAHYGTLSLVSGASLLASALTLDLLSGELREAFLHESQGGRGTSEARHRELEAELRNRQRIFYGLSAGGAVLVATGLGLYTYHLLSDDAPPGPAPAPQTVSLTPVVGPGLLEVRLGLDF